MTFSQKQAYKFAARMPVAMVALLAMASMGRGDVQTFDKPAPVGTPDYIMEHTPNLRCGDAATNGKMPNHVIHYVGGDRGWVLGGPKMVAFYLDKIFNKHEPADVLFCM